MDKEKKIMIRNLVISGLIIVFFVCIVFIYYISLYFQTKNNIINRGRINAIEAAEQINKHLSSSMDILKLACYTLDNMIREDRSNEEILDYLTNETVAVRDSLIANTTGIYGYINGEYLDGSGWIPDEGYDPQERPWYIEAKGGNGRFVVVDPYKDLDTGEVTIAIAKTLCDTKSVAGIDISIDELQTMTEEYVKNDPSSAEFIVNARGRILAHSDSSLTGLRFFDEKYPLGALISEKMKTTEDSYFYLAYDKKDYMVYVMPLENEWTCISIIDATNDFSKLRIPLFITIITAVTLVGSFSFFMISSDRKGREARELTIKSERATAASEAKSSFLSSMSHEIRTPINAILGMNEMILREAEDDDILSYSENIRAAGNTLMGIINDVLDFSKIEAGKVEIIPVVYDLSSLVNDLVNMIRTRADDKGLRLNLEFEGDIPRMLQGDEIRIKQIITNILTNAVKYTEKGSVTFSIGYERITQEDSIILLKVAVKDTGIGIKPEDMDKLFSKFDRIEENKNRNVEGTGLGMSITKSLLSLMDSSLQVESTYGEGSVFSFSLKQMVIDWIPLGNYETSCRSGADERVKYKEIFTAPDAAVLMVDDNRMNLMVFESLVKKTLIKVDCAESGNEGLELAHRKKYDVIFLDHMMPEKDGIETLNEMREKDLLNEDTPVICLTANALSGAREQYISKGFNDYLSKPINSVLLEKMLIHYLPADKVKLTDDDTEEAKTAVPDNLALLAEKTGIDVEKGLNTSVSTETYISILRVFHDTLEKKAEEIDGYYNAMDLENYTIQVHALKSSAIILGADSLGEKARLLEAAGKDNDTEYIRGHHEDLIKEYRELKEPLSELFSGEDDRDQITWEADEEKMMEVYWELYSAAEDIDSERLEEIVEEMRGYIIPEEERELYKKLKDAADAYEYDDIRDLLRAEKGFGQGGVL